MGNDASSLSPRTRLTQALDGFLTKVLDPARAERDKFTGSEQRKTTLDDNVAIFENYLAGVRSLQRILVALHEWSTANGSGHRGLQEKKKNTRAQTEEQMNRLAVLVERTYRRFVQKRSWFAAIAGGIIGVAAIPAAVAAGTVAVAIGGGAGAVACLRYAFYTGRKLSLKASFEAMTDMNTRQDLINLITEYEKGTDASANNLRVVLDKLIGSSEMHSINNASDIERLDDGRALFAKRSEKAAAVDDDDGRDIVTKRSEKVAADVDHDDRFCFYCYETFNSDNKAMMLNTGKQCHLHPCHLDCLERMYRDVPPGKDPICCLCHRQVRHGSSRQDWFVPA